MSASAILSPQREALAVEALRHTGRLRLQVRGESMLPALWPGDVVEITACSLDGVRQGEIVLAFREGRFFLHRFLAHREPNGFLTRGDSMPGPDPVFPADALLGKLMHVLREGQTVSAPVRPWSRVVGLFFCYCRLARRAVLRFHSWRNSQRLQVADLETA
jgi:signal peptidase